MKHPEVASYDVREGMIAAPLHGGPWHGKTVGIRDADSQLIIVNGPREGNHRIWITHLYERIKGRYEFVSTHVETIDGY